MKLNVVVNDNGTFSTPEEFEYDPLKFEDFQKIQKILFEKGTWLNEKHDGYRQLSMTLTSGN
jgi:hypothetical protein